MTLDEAGEIFRYWEHSPPAHLMLQTIAQMLGWTPRPAAADVKSLAAMVAAPPPGLAIARRGGLGMPAPLDLDGLRARNLALAGMRATG